VPFFIKRTGLLSSFIPCEISDQQKPTGAGPQYHSIVNKSHDRKTAIAGSPADGRGKSNTSGPNFRSKPGDGLVFHIMEIQGFRAYLGTISAF